MTKQTSPARGLMSAQAAAAGVRRTSSAETVRVALVSQLADGVLMVIATTLKRGATYHDSWSVTPSFAVASVTVVDNRPSHRARYVSRATAAEPSLAPDTTYTITYAIVMRAGERVWVGSGSIAVTVSSDGSLMLLKRNRRGDH